MFMSKFSASATSILNIDVVLKNLREAIDNLVALRKDGGSNTHVLFKQKILTLSRTLRNFLDKCLIPPGEHSLSK